MNKNKTVYYIYRYPLAAIACLIFSGLAFAQEKTATQIRNEFAHVESEDAGLALPLVALWSVGEKPDGFTPDYQVQLIKSGRHILPSFHISSPMGRKLPRSYYVSALDFSKKNHIPICLVGTQFEHLLTDDPEFFNLPAARNPNVVIGGKVEPLVSPFGPVENWSKAGRMWTANSLLGDLQLIYPDPPGVIFLSNNEHKKLKVNEVGKTDYYKNHKSLFGSSFATHRVLGDAWITRYRALQKGMTDGLSNNTWKNVSRYIGYNAYQFTVGNSYGWLDSSLYVPGRLQPWPLAWDGASASYYVRPYDDSTDFTWFSPQVHAMSWPFMFEETRRDNPDFWFELSVWDGGKDQRAQYTRKGQTFSPARYKGMVQFGAWLLRPRVIREFRMWDETIRNEGKYLDAILDGVDAIYANPILEKFWRHGKLLPNRQRRHPYDSNIPAEYVDKDRWFLLETVPPLAKYQSLNNEIPVFAVAFEIGVSPKREWLIYAHSPKGEFKKVEFVLEPFGEVSSKVTPAGVFVHVKEAGRSIVTLGDNSRPMPPVLSVQ